MRRVLWIGAGASIPAGYPPAYRLLSELEKEASSSIDAGLRDAWERFAAFRAAATGTERTLLWSANPEVVLSVPDLLDAALSADDERIRTAFVSPALQALRARGAGKIADERADSITPEDIEREYDRKERLRLTEARHARDALLYVLDHFFGWRHFNERTVDGYRLREHLRHELRDLQDGDVVITTNWDTTVERTLLEDGRWSPVDGYGFEARLTPVPPEVRSILSSGREWTVPLPAWPEWAPRRSAVRVLKIHGSYGWRTRGRFGPRVDEPGRVYLHEQFLSAMPLVSPGAEPDLDERDFVQLWDETEPDAYDPSDRLLYVYPTYLKQIAGSTLQDIWNEADLALRGATELRVLGASLPEADGAVRVLLNSVRYRVREGSLRVTIDDPSSVTHDRWRAFLGTSVEARQRRAGEQ